MLCQQWFSAHYVSNANSITHLVCGPSPHTDGLHSQTSSGKRSHRGSTAIQWKRKGHWPIDIQLQYHSLKDKEATFTPRGVRRNCKVVIFTTDQWFHMRQKQHCWLWITRWGYKDERAMFWAMFHNHFLFEVIMFVYLIVYLPFKSYTLLNIICSLSVSHPSSSEIKFAW